LRGRIGRAASFLVFGHNSGREPACRVPGHN
jgi:hypothetical protein